MWTAEPNRFAVAELQDLAPGRALDVAAGEGRNAVWLASRGWQVTAVDFSAAGLDKGRWLAQARGVTVDWVHADVRDYQPEAASFQLVLVAYLQPEQCAGRFPVRVLPFRTSPSGVLAPQPAGWSLGTKPCQVRYASNQGLARSWSRSSWTARRWHAVLAAVCPAKALTSSDWSIPSVRWPHGGGSDVRADWAFHGFDA